MDACLCVHVCSYLNVYCVYMLRMHSSICRVFYCVHVFVCVHVCILCVHAWMCLCASDICVRVYACVCLWMLVSSRVPITKTLQCTYVLMHVDTYYLMFKRQKQTTHGCWNVKHLLSTLCEVFVYILQLFWYPHHWRVFCSFFLNFILYNV